MPIFHIGNAAFVVDKDGNRSELKPISEYEYKPSQIDGEKEGFEFSGAVSGSFTVELSSESANMLARMFRHLEYKRFVAPMLYRIQPPRSQSIKIGGTYLNSKAAFMHQLLHREDEST